MEFLQTREEQATGGEVTHLPPRRLIGRCQETHTVESGAFRSLTKSSNISPECIVLTDLVDSDDGNIKCIRYMPFPLNLSLSAMYLLSLL